VKAQVKTMLSFSQAVVEAIKFFPTAIS